MVEFISGGPDGLIEVWGGGFLGLGFFMTL